jgi:hypothetical protein
MEDRAIESFDQIFLSIFLWSDKTHRKYGLYREAQTEGLSGGGTNSAVAYMRGRQRSCMRTCIGICSYVLTVVMNDLAVINRMYVSNLAGLSHRAAIPEARRPQHLPRTDLYAGASVSGVLQPPLVLGVLSRLVKHPP